MPDKSTISEECLKKIVESVEAIKYGSVTLVVQDGIIIQIEKKEKIKVT